MARGVAALCIGGLVTITVVGFFLPDGAPLSDRDLTALVGGSDPGWCRYCPNCYLSNMCMNDTDGCIGKSLGDPCGDEEHGWTGMAPQTCSAHLGDDYCSPSGPEVDVLCGGKYDCKCDKDPYHEEQLVCLEDVPTLVSYRTEIVADPKCDAGTYALPTTPLKSCE